MPCGVSVEISLKSKFSFSIVERGSNFIAPGIHSFAPLFLRRVGVAVTAAKHRNLASIPRSRRVRICAVKNRIVV